MIVKIVEPQANLNLFKIHYDLHGKSLSMLQTRMVLSDYLQDEAGMSQEDAYSYLDNISSTENELNDFILKYLKWHHGGLEVDKCVFCKKDAPVSELEENSTCYSYGNKRICDCCAQELDNKQY
jgi:hypothetical protein